MQIFIQISQLLITFQSIIAIVDTMIGNRPWSLSHMWCPAIFGISYLIFNFVYIYIFKGTNVYGLPFIYSILDWNDEIRDLNNISFNKTESGEYQVSFENGTSIGTREEFLTNMPDKFDYYDLPKSNSDGFGISIAVSFGLCVACPIFYSVFYGLSKLRDWLWRKKYNVDNC